jgi:hypothetical protein
VTDDLSRAGQTLMDEHVDLGCNCDVSVRYPADATEVTDADVVHEDGCRLLELAERLN